MNLTDPRFHNVEKARECIRVTPHLQGFDRVPSGPDALGAITDLVFAYKPVPKKKKSAPFNSPLLSSEKGIAALALALGADTVGDLTQAESSIVKSLPDVKSSKVNALRHKIRDGGDPLGEAFCNIRSADVRRVETLRRSEGRRLQEERVQLQLLATDYLKVRTRRIKTLGEAPKPGEFCRESYLGDRKADFVIGLWDGRILALECKVSNSSTNSVKRLNNDAAVKAETWRKEFGTSQVVPAAVLTGVFALLNLENAQSRGLSLFWAHDLNAMTTWIASTKS